MKIERIRFKNINSLRGEWEIDFRSKEFKQSGIFAITGPTGAGKSTILDAITLALYGKTPRHGRVTSGENELMSKHTGECFAEIEFKGKDNRHYISRWSQHRARKSPNGNLQNPIILLEEVNGKVIETTKISNWERAVEEVSGLDFDRFTRSVLLAQGNFTAFLKAKENEKSAILERMTGSEIYRKIGIEAHKYEKEYKERVNHIKEKLKGVEPLPKEQRDILENRLKQLKKLLKQEEAEYSKQVELKQLYQNRDKLTVKIKESEEEFKNIEKKIKNGIKEQNIVSQWEDAQKILIELKNIEKQETELSQTLQQIDSITKDIDVLNVELADIEKSYENTKEEYEKFRQNESQKREALKSARKIDTLIDEKQNILSQHKKSAKELQGEIEEYKNKLDKLHQSLSKIHKEHDKELKLLQKSAHLKRVSKDMGHIISTIDELGRVDEETKLLYQERSKIEKSIEKEKKDARVILEEVDSNQAKINEFVNKLQDLQIHIEEIIGDRDLSDIQKEYEELQHQNSILSKLQHLYENRDRLSREKNVINNEILKKSESIEQEKGALKLMNIVLQKQQQLKASIEDRLNTERTAMSLDERRKELQEGTPCPLCGSLTHPWGSRSFTRKVSKTEKELKDVSQELEEMLKTKSRHDANVESLTQTIQMLTKQLEQKELELEAIKKQIKAYLFEIPEEYVELSGTALKQKLEDINSNITRIKSMIDGAEELNKEYNRLKDILNRYKLEQESKKTKMGIAKSRINSLKEQLSQIDDKINREQSHREELVQKLDKFAQIYHIKWSGESDIEPFLNLKKQYRDYELALSKIENLSDEISKKEGEKELLNNSIKIKNEQLQKILKDINTIEIEIDNLHKRKLAIFGDRDCNEYENFLNKSKEILEKRVEIEQKKLQKAREKKQILSTKRAELSKQIEKLKKSIKEERDSLSKKLKGSKLSLDRVKELDIPKDEYIKLKSRFDGLDKERSILKNRLKEYKKELSEIQNRLNMSNKSIDDIENELLIYRKKVSEYNQTIGEISQKLKADDETIAKNSQIVKELQEAVSEYGVWQKLSELIGSHDGSKFAKFAQTLTMEYLLKLANKHLYILDRRYRIRQKGILDFEIIDTYQADVVRPISTLSGGESFLVSLSLALALSDLAGSRIKIETLFLDEGFGTLDSETLETVLSALDKLNNQGKMVGVISHVNALKERITTRIEVNSSGGIGYLDSKYRVI